MSLTEYEEKYHDLLHEEWRNSNMKHSYAVFVQRKHEGLTNEN